MILEKNMISKIITGYVIYAKLLPIIDLS